MDKINKAGGERLFKSASHVIDIYRPFSPKNKNIIEANALSLEDKFRVYWDYVVTQLTLKWWFDFPDKKHKDFNEFLEGNDTSVSECLVGWYWRFKNRIFKT